MQKELSSKELLFCSYYSRDRNAREAAAKSGYIFSDKSAVKLLKKPAIKAEIERLSNLIKATNDDIIAGYYRLAFGCVSDAIRLMFDGESGELDFEKLDLFNVADIKRKKDGIEIKFFDRLKALESLENFCQNTDDSCSSFYSAIEKGAAALRNDTNGKI